MSRRGHTRIRNEHARAPVAAAVAIGVALGFALLAAPAPAASLRPTGAETAVLVQPDPAPSTGPGRPRGKPGPEAWQFRPTDRGDLRRAKQRAKGGGGRPKAPGQSGPLGATSVSANADGLFWGDNLARNLGVPADPTGAAGPDYYFEHVNSVVGTYNRTSLTQTNEDQLDVFTGPTGLATFDPQVQWDQEAQRWLYVSIGEESATARSFIVFGWSRTTNPSAGFGGANWCRYAIDTGVRLDDYPKLGHSDRHILIGTNVFNGNTFETSRIWALPKPVNGATVCPTSFGIPYFGSPSSPLETADGGEAFTPVPANTVEADGGSGYVVAADDPSITANQLMVWRVAGTKGSPTLEEVGEVGVSSYAVPANAPQPTGKDLDTLDARLTQAVAQPDPDRAGAEAIWTQHTINGPGGRSAARWYELLPGACSAGSCPAGALAQEGTISDASAYIFNAAISPTATGDAAAIQYNRGGSSDLVSIRAQSRVSGDAAGTMGGEQVLVTSSETANDFSCTGRRQYCRWGDYAGASPDPADASTVWGTNMYNGADSGGSSKVGWYTRNFALVPQTATP